jgi:hypothetical protein
MATVKTVLQGTRKYVINVTGIWDTADETDVIIVDRSALIGPNGKDVPTYIRVDEITALIGPFDYVQLEFKHGGGDETIELFQGQGYVDYRPAGGKVAATAPSLVTDGDITLTTAGGAAGDSYSLYIHMTLKD